MASQCLFLSGCGGLSPCNQSGAGNQYTPKRFPQGFLAKRPGLEMAEEK